MHLIPCILCLFALAAQDAPVQAKEPALKRGAALFNAGNYAEAAEQFREAAAAEPKNALARLYLAFALKKQFKPGSESPENVRFAADAEAGFKAVLAMDPSNRYALLELANLAYDRKDPDRAVSWSNRAIEADPDNKDAYLMLAMVGLGRWRPVDTQAREECGMGVDDPGPLSKAEVRSALRDEWLPVLDRALANLDEALVIDPHWEQAIAYKVQVIRSRADLMESEDDYRAEIAQADEWVKRFNDERELRAKYAEASVSQLPQLDQQVGKDGVPVIRVGPRVQSLKLVRRVEPEYPPAAKDLQIQGTVEFDVEIDADGNVVSATPIVGQPVLVDAARDALMQCKYAPTLVKGKPVGVRTMAVVLVWPGQPPPVEVPVPVSE